MDSRATENEILELEKKLLHPTAEPISSLPLGFLKSITRGFRDEEELGRGGYGVVYKGHLQCGLIVAVKKIHNLHLVEDDIRLFQREVTSLMGIKHQNVVQLLGYCAESRWEMVKHPNGNYVPAQIPERIFCFEYLCNKGLDNHLSDESSGLEWKMRYKIIKGICSGLNFLHACNIIHLDLKPQNILMDSSMVPKIADFGLSRLLGEQKYQTVTKSPAGSLGYMAPEYMIQGLISQKADIFSLGVIIIEILTGHRDYPLYPQSTKADLEAFTEKVLGNWTNRFERQSKCSYKAVELHSTQQVKQCMDITLKCVHPNKMKRPNALNIIEILNAVEASYVQKGKDLPVDHYQKMDGRDRLPTCSSSSSSRCTGSVCFASLLIDGNQEGVQRPPDGLMAPLNTTSAMKDVDNAPAKIPEDMSNKKETSGTAVGMVIRTSPHPPRLPGRNARTRNWEVNKAAYLNLLNKKGSQDSSSK